MILTLGEGYVNEVTWNGLGLVSYCIAPHFKSNHAAASRIDALVQYFLDQGMPFVRRRDGEVIATVCAGSDTGNLGNLGTDRTDTEF